MRMVIGIAWTALAFGAGAPAGAATITLSTGESLAVTILERHDTTVTVEHPVLGALEIPLAEVTALVEAEVAAEPAEATAPPPPAAGTAPPAPTPPSFWAALFPSFDSQFELGGSGSSGNTDTGDVRVGLRTKRANDTSRMKVGGTYQQSTSSGDTIRNQANAFVVHDWIFPGSPWFTFVKGNYDYDQFRAWEHRVSGFGGVGYGLIQNGTLEMTTRIGGGGTREFGGSNELRPEGLISGAVVKWKPSEAQTVSAYATLYPDLSDFFEFRVLTGLEWLIALDQADGLNLKFGLENEYESITDRGELHNDLKYYGALVIDF